MSIFEQGLSPGQASLVRWAGYGLASAGLLAGLMRLLQAGPVWSGLLLILAPAALAVAAFTPDLFEIRWRGGARRLNPFLGAPACFVFAVGLALQVETIALPLAGALVGAATFLLLSLKGRWRPGLASPIAFQLVMAIAGAGFGYGAVATVDVDWDRSAPQVLQVQVLDKYVTHGRSSTAYHLRLPPFATRAKPSSITVGSKTYGALNVGDQVCVYEHRGALGLAWFTAKACDAAW